MGEFFYAVTNFFTTILHFIENSFTGLLSLLGMIPSAIATLGTILAYIPAPVGAFAFAAISLSVVMLLIGR